MLIYIVNDNKAILFGCSEEASWACLWEDQEKPFIQRESIAATLGTAMVDYE